MSSKLKLLNANGKTLTIENGDTNIVDINISVGTMPTTAGTIGDIVFTFTPVAGGNIGWVYTSTGWKTFGTIGA